MKAYRLFNLLIVLSLALSGVFVVPPQQVQAAVSVGAIAIIGIDTDDPDTLTFVALEDIPEGEVIRFTDDGWLNTGSFRIGEGGTQWTSPSGGITAGTVVSKSNPFDSENWSANNTDLGTGGMNFSTSGDQVIAFQGLATSPTMVYAINADSGTPKTNGWQDNATSTNTSALPNGLTEGTSAVGLFQTVTEVDDAHYDCSKGTSGTKAELLDLISNRENWLLSDTAYGAYSSWTGCPATFTVTTIDITPTVDSTTPGNGDTNVLVGSDLAVTFSEAVTATDPWATLDCGSGSLALTLSGSGTDYAVHPNAPLPYSASCTATVLATQVADTDGTPNNMAADYTWTFTTSSADALPTVSSTVPDTAATGVAANADVVINFSEAVSITGSFFDLSCSISGSHGGTVSGGAVSYTIDTADFLPGEVCTATVQNDQVTDQDGTPDNMAADYTWTFTVAAATAVCGDPYIPIHIIQGSGSTSPLTGTVVTEGVVTGDLQNINEMSGFFIQSLSAAADADPATSEGIFVYGFNTAVVPGDHVRVSGTIVEYTALDSSTGSPGRHGMITELTTTTTTVCSSGNPLPDPVEINLPTSGDSSFNLEPYEGMLVTFPQTLTVQQNYFQGRFGQVTLGAGGRIANMHNFAKNGGSLYEYTRMIILDDSRHYQNLNPISYYSADGDLRAGDTVVNVTGILDQGHVNSDYKTADISYGWPDIYYRLQPTVAPVFTQVNPRPATPPAVGGRIKVASANVLNYFITLDMAPARTTFPYNSSNTPRGADSAAEFTRQQAKIVAELAGLNADVVGLMEIESWDTPAAPQALVNALNTYIGTPGLYAAVADPALGYFDPATDGGDYIQTALIYKTSTVTPVGASISTDAAIFDRSPFAQEFQEISSGEQFVVVVNHFKSKGSCPAVGDPNADQGDGQGCWNLKRREQAAELLNFINTSLAPLDPDVLVIGDLNSYGAEDPIADLVAGGLVNQVATFVPEADRYSYVFDGTAGYLDHGLGTLSTTPQISDVAFWHVNADEPLIIDYNLEFKGGTNSPDLYQPHQYKASDHDPVLIGLNLSPLTTIWVNDDWAALPNGTLVSAGGGTHIMGYDAFVTLQAGIAAAPAGGTVNVLNGTYSETGQIVISKNLTINGESAAGTIIKPTASTGGSGDARGWFLVNAGMVFNLSNVTLDGTGYDIHQAIRSLGTGTISDNIIQNIVYPGYLGTAVVLFDDMTVDGNSFSNIGRIGVIAFGTGVTTAVISDNIYTGKGAGDWLDYGVEIGGGAIATISGNTISNNLGVASIDGSTSAAILVSTYYGAGSTATITGNILSGNTTGIAVGYDAADTSTVTAEMNQIVGNTYAISTTAPLVDGSPNWFGSVTGPAAGTIDGSVGYTPWCGDAGCTFFLPTGSGYYEIPGGTSGADVQAILNNAPEGSTIKFLGSTGSLSGGYVINTPHLTIILADGTVIQNASPCFTVNASYTTITTASIGGAKCVPTSGNNGIDVAAGLVNIIIEGIEFDGTDQATGDGVHFAGGITDFQVINNYFHDLDGDGVEFTVQPTPQPTATTLDIQGNLFKNNGGLGVNNSAGTLALNAEFNSWGNIGGAAAGDGISSFVDADPFTHVDLSMTSSGTPWANQVLNTATSTITYTVYANLQNVLGADFVLTYDPAVVSIDSTTASTDFDPIPGETSVLDTTVSGQIHFIGFKVPAVSGANLALFTVTFKPVAPGTSALNLDEAIDSFSMFPGYGPSGNIYASDLLDGSVTVIAPPVLASTDLPGYYLTTDPQEFHVSLTNPATGGSFSNVLLNFRISNAVIADLTLEYDAGGTWLPLPLTQDGTDLVGSYGPALGFPIIPGYAATSAFRVTAATAKNYPVAITLNDLVSTPVNAELARLEQTAVVYAKPVITSADLIGPYLVGTAQDFTLTITDPSGIPEPFELVFTFPAGTTIVYDGVTYTCTTTCPPIPVTLAAASNDLTFTVTFPAAFSGDVTVTLFDSDWTPADRPLATLTQTGVVAYDTFAVTGTVSMQGRGSYRADVPMTLTGPTLFAYGPFTAISNNLLSGNLSFGTVASTTYTITTNQPRYLNVTADLLRQKVVSAAATISPLELKGGNAVWTDNIISVLDASLIGTQYGWLTTANDGDVNYSGKVDIFDLALVGGNYDLDSSEAYAGVGGLFPAWVP